MALTQGVLLQGADGRAATVLSRPCRCAAHVARAGELRQGQWPLYEAVFKCLGIPAEDRDCVFKGEVQQGDGPAGPVSYLRQRMVSCYRDASRVFREYLDMTAPDAR